MLAMTSDSSPKSNIVGRRCVALIGSSGGGTATLGHTQPLEFFRIIQEELDRIIANGGKESIMLSQAVFISLDDGRGMDSTSGSESATLYHIEDSVQQLHHGKLDEINQQVAELDKNLAESINCGNIQGLISVSCKVSLFSKTLQAAAERDIPVTGTGGQSLSLAASTHNIRLVGNAGGSVATTLQTKAISFTHALAKDWKLDYSPWISKPDSIRKRHYPTWRSVLNSCLPAFWGVVVCKRFILGMILSTTSNYALLFEQLESFALPTACAVVMATSRRNSSNVMMAAVIASTACRQSVLGGLLAGWIASFLEERILCFCILYGNVPATMTNLLSTGLVGVLTAALVFPFAIFLGACTQWFRSTVIISLLEERQDGYEALRVLSLFSLGCVFCYGSKVGWYHSIFLPIILIEMELGDASFLGAVDQLVLVLVSAGICAATWITGGEKDVSLVKRGVLINLSCGDFIEACYPIMEKHAVINYAGYAASGISVAMMTADSKSSAYFPFPLSIWLAESRKQMALASAVAAGIPFFATLLNHFVTKRQHKGGKDS